MRLAIPIDILQLPGVSKKARIVIFYYVFGGSRRPCALQSGQICEIIGMTRADGTPDLANFRTCRSQLVHAGLLSRTELQTPQGKRAGFSAVLPVLPEAAVHALVGAASLIERTVEVGEQRDFPEVYLYLDEEDRAVVEAAGDAGSEWWMMLNNAFRQPPFRSIVDREQPSLRRFWASAMLHAANNPWVDVGEPVSRIRLQAVLMALAHDLQEGLVAPEGDLGVWLEGALRVAGRSTVRAPLPSAGVLARDMRLLSRVGYLTVADHMAG